MNYVIETKNKEYININKLDAGNLYYDEQDKPWFRTMSYRGPETGNCILNIETGTLYKGDNEYVKNKKFRLPKPGETVTITAQ